MSGLFEHIAAFDNDERRHARQAVAVAHKRVSDRVDTFVKNATSMTDFNSRLSLVEDDVRQIIAEVVSEYGGNAETIYNSITAGWEDLTRGPDGKWSAPSSDDSDSEEESSDIDTELADAPSAVGEGTLAGMRPFQAADAPEGAGGAVKRESLPKGNKDAQGGPSPKIDKGTAGDEKSNKSRSVDDEDSQSPVPTEEQKVTDGRGDAEKGTSDRKNEDASSHSKNTLKSEELPTGDEWAGFAEGGEKGPKTKTFPDKNQADPVTSAVDPDKNPIIENLNAWTLESEQTTAAFHEAISPVPGDVDPNDDPGYSQFKNDLGAHHYDQKGNGYEPCPHCGTPSERGYPQCETCGDIKEPPPSRGGDWINPEESDPTYGEY